MLKIYLIKFNIKLQSLQNSRDSKIFKEINIFERIIINVKIFSHLSQEYCFNNETTDSWIMVLSFNLCI